MYFKLDIYAALARYAFRSADIIIGIRIDVYTEIIRKYFDVDFPESKIVRAK